MFLILAMKFYFDLDLSHKNFNYQNHVEKCSLSVFLNFNMHVSIHAYQQQETG